MISRAATLNKPVRLVRHWVWDTPVRLLIGISCSVALGWLAVRGMDWGLVAERFETLPVGWILVALVIMLAAGVFRAYRWRVLLMGERVSVGDLLPPFVIAIIVFSSIGIRPLRKGVRMPSRSQGEMASVPQQVRGS